MLRKSTFFAVAAALLSLPSRLLAGGPPWLCLPIDGVTPDNAQACAELIDAKLKTKLWQRSGPYGGGAAIRQDGDQRYLTFYMQEDIGLGEVETALKGSEFSIPRDKLKLFGHVIMEIDAEKTSSKKLVAALDALSNVSVAKSEGNKNALLVTVQMPYPVVKDRPKPESVGWAKFESNDYTSERPTKSETPISPEALPNLDTFRDIVAKHDANLKDVRWSTTHACRALGCVSAPNADTVVAAVSERTSPKGN